MASWKLRRPKPLFSLSLPFSSTCGKHALCIRAEIEFRTCPALSIYERCQENSSKFFRPLCIGFWNPSALTGTGGHWSNSYGSGQHWSTLVEFWLELVDTGQNLDGLVSTGQRWWNFGWSWAILVKRQVMHFGLVKTMIRLGWNRRMGVGMWCVLQDC